eukprot:TRINITY_DN66838_c0_g2_i2.p1 TRINITY_DN66838_c0_g2~~TRINITY_DN66838_c0_g2_i2.p1  ORF type:complete len:1466 (+),score=266.39 TRINITY_DN66838_c0_g2_i2:96-4493(+)
MADVAVAADVNLPASGETLGSSDQPAPLPSKSSSTGLADEVGGGMEAWSSLAAMSQERLLEELAAAVQRRVATPLPGESPMPVLPMCPSAADSTSVPAPPTIPRGLEPAVAAAVADSEDDSPRPRHCLPRYDMSPGDLEEMDARSRRLVARISATRTSLQCLRSDVKRHKEKQQEFLEQLDILSREELAKTDLELRQKITALQEMQVQLREVSERQDREQETLQTQSDEMLAYHQSCERRVQFLMDHLVNLLSNGPSCTNFEGILREIVADGEERFFLSEGRLELFARHLEEARQENRVHAQRLSDAQCKTTAIHDKTCTMQNDVFEQMLQVQHHVFQPADKAGQRKGRQRPASPRVEAPSLEGGGSVSSTCPAPPVADAKADVASYHYIEQAEASYQFFKAALDAASGRCLGRPCAVQGMEGKELELLSSSSHEVIAVGNGLHKGGHAIDASPVDTATDLNSLAGSPAGSPVRSTRLMRSSVSQELADAVGSTKKLLQGHAADAPGNAAAAVPSGSSGEPSAWQRVVAPKAVASGEKAALEEADAACRATTARQLDSVFVQCASPTHQGPEDAVATAAVEKAASATAADSANPNSVHEAVLVVATGGMPPRQVSQGSAAPTEPPPSATVSPTNAERLPTKEPASYSATEAAQCHSEGTPEAVEARASAQTLSTARSENGMGPQAPAQQQDELAVTPLTLAGPAAAGSRRTQADGTVQKAVAIRPGRRMGSPRRGGVGSPLKRPSSPNTRLHVAPPGSSSLLLGTARGGVGTPVRGASNTASGDSKRQLASPIRRPAGAMAAKVIARPASPQGARTAVFGSWITPATAVRPAASPPRQRAGSPSQPRGAPSPTRRVPSPPRRTTSPLQRAPSPPRRAPSPPRSDNLTMTAASTASSAGAARPRPSSPPRSGVKGHGVSASSGATSPGVAGRGAVRAPASKQPFAAPPHAADNSRSTGRSRSPGRRSGGTSSPSKDLPSQPQQPAMQLPAPAAGASASGTSSQAPRGSYDGVLEKLLHEALISVNFDFKVIRVNGSRGIYRFGTDCEAIVRLSGASAAGGGSRSAVGDAADEGKQPAAKQELLVSADGRPFEPIESFLQDFKGLDSARKSAALPASSGAKFPPRGSSPPRGGSSPPRGGSQLRGASPGCGSSPLRGSSPSRRNASPTRRPVTSVPTAAPAAAQPPFSAKPGVCASADTQRPASAGRRSTTSNAMEAEVRRVPSLGRGRVDNTTPEVVAGTNSYAFVGTLSSTSTGAGNAGPSQSRTETAASASAQAMPAEGGGGSWSGKAAGSHSGSGGAYAVPSPRSQLSLTEPSTLADCSRISANSGSGGEATGPADTSRMHGGGRSISPPTARVLVTPRASVGGTLHVAQPPGHYPAVVPAQAPYMFAAAPPAAGVVTRTPSAPPGYGQQPRPLLAATAAATVAAASPRPHVPVAAGFQGGLAGSWVAMPMVVAPGSAGAHKA